MKRLAPIALIPVFTVLSACTTVGTVPASHVANATLEMANGLPAGTVQLVSDGEKVTLTAAVAGMSPGVHGIHLHTTGSCVAPDFKSAGGHLNPDGRQHGMDNPMGSHVGDLPNITVSDAGAGTISVALQGTQAELMETLFDADGTAIVVHAGPDDYKTDPSGNSGGRIACGVLKKA
ncbi:MAG: superoxide dismutase family protein [Novosphingobium sp.]|nr:superoxide dismutase family protein [Novosphingobium sp.]